MSAAVTPRERMLALASDREIDEMMTALLLLDQHFSLPREFELTVRLALIEQWRERGMMSDG